MREENDLCIEIKFRRHFCNCPALMVVCIQALANVGGEGHAMQGSAPAFDGSFEPDIIIGRHPATFLFFNAFPFLQFVPIYSAHTVER
jgi:hypothetical protein